MTRFEDITNSNKKNNIEISVKQKKQVETQLIGQILPHNNHRIWEINDETLEITEAKFIVATALVFGQKPKKEIAVKKNMLTFLP